MANQLTMAKISAIQTLHKARLSNRKIAEILGIHRDTVARHLRLAESENRPNAPPGSRGLSAAKSSDVHGHRPRPPPHVERAKSRQNFRCNPLHSHHRCDTIKRNPDICSPADFDATISGRF